MMILLKTLVAAVAIGYTGLILLIYFKQDKIVFHPEKLSKDHKYEFPIAHEEGFLNSHNDENINYIAFFGGMFWAATETGLYYTKNIALNDIDKNRLFVHKKKLSK